jgi:hypothetical protein
MNQYTHFSRKEIVMKLANWLKGGSLMLLGVFAIVAGGCSSGGQQRAASAVSGLQELRGQMTDAHGQVDKTLASMHAMQNTNDLKSAFSKFSDDVDDTQADAQKIKDTVADMHDRGAEYTKKWQDEMSAVTDPTLKQVAQQRRDAVQQNYSNIQSKFDAARDAYKVFYGDLTSLRTYLSNDLTSEGVAAAKPSFDKTDADAQALHAAAKDVTDAMDKVMVALPGGGANLPNNGQ